MKTAGIIAEYNPFHNGHAWQIAQLKKQGFDAVVCVCSPGVVQRGGPAFFPAEVRTRAALAGGADLVISLPAPYALCSAEGFAAAGVALLEALGCVDALCFGTETQSAGCILRTAQMLESKEFTPLLRLRLEQGLPFAAARADAAELLCPGAGKLLQNPNEILGTEYCRAILRQKSRMQPLALVRKGAAHDAPLDAQEKQYASASALRALAAEKGVDALAPYVPLECLAVYRKAVQTGAYADPRVWDTALLSRLRAMDAQQMHLVRGAAEGLENRLYDAVHQAGTLDEVIEYMKTKRYPTARLRRFVMDAALGYGTELPALPAYLHILGASETGLSVLQRAKQTAKLPLSHSLSQLEKTGEAARTIARAHGAAEDLAALCLHRPAPMGTAYTAKPVFPEEEAEE